MLHVKLVLTPRNVSITDEDESDGNVDSGVPSSNPDLPSSNMLSEEQEYLEEMEESAFNPFGDKPLDEIEIEIKEEPLNNSEEIDVEASDGDDPIYRDGTKDDTIHMTVTGLRPRRTEYFKPLLRAERATIAKYAGITLPLGEVEPQFTGRNKLCVEPTARIRAKPYGSCFFHSISFLISGRQNFDLLLRHQVCNYISEAKNLRRLRSYIDPQYKTGKQYLRGSGMRNRKTWATTVEIMAMAQMLQTDIVIYYNKSWDRFPASGNQEEVTENAFYLENKSKDHFNPVTDM